jgi:hypothetical protein
MKSTEADLLRTFISDEEAAFADKRQGKFWPANHHRIAPLATKISGLLEDDEKT